MVDAVNISALKCEVKTLRLENQDLLYERDHLSSFLSEVQHWNKELNSENDALKKSMSKMDKINSKLYEECRELESDKKDIERKLILSEDRAKTLEVIRSAPMNIYIEKQRKVIEAQYEEIDNLNKKLVDSESKHKVEVEDKKKMVITIKGLEKRLAACSLVETSKQVEDNVKEIAFSNRPWVTNTTTLEMLRID